MARHYPGKSILLRPVQAVRPPTSQKRSHLLLAGYRRAMPGTARWSASNRVRTCRPDQIAMGPATATGRRTTRRPPRSVLTARARETRPRGAAQDGRKSTARRLPGRNTYTVPVYARAGRNGARLKPSGRAVCLRHLSASRRLPIPHARAGAYPRGRPRHNRPGA